MPNALNVNRKAVRADYASGMKRKDICEKYNISMNTLKSWISRYGWSGRRSEKWYRDYLLSYFSYRQLYEIVMACAEICRESEL